MTDLERARELQLGQLCPCAEHAYEPPYERIAAALAAARREGAEEMRERATTALAPIADEEMPEPYWDNARAQRMNWACAVGRCLNRVRALPLTPEEPT